MEPLGSDYRGDVLLAVHRQVSEVEDVEPGMDDHGGGCSGTEPGCARGLGRRLRRGPEPLADCGRRTGAGAGVTAREVGLRPVTGLRSRR